MASLDAVRGDLALLILYLNKAEARDKICRAIQYGSKFISNGEPGPAQNVDKSTSLARKVFRLCKFVNDLHALISPPAKGTPLPLILLGKSKNAMLSTFLFLDQIVWAGRTGIYKNKERAEFLGRIAFYCFLGSNPPSEKVAARPITYTPCNAIKWPNTPVIIINNQHDLTSNFMPYEGVEKPI